MEFGMALRSAEASIEIEPTYAKAY